MQSLLAVDVAYQIMRDRQRDAVQRALAAHAQIAATQPRSQVPALAQLWLARTLRRLAARLDPSVVCEPAPAASIAIAR